MKAKYKTQFGSCFLKIYFEFLINKILLKLMNIEKTEEIFIKINASDINLTSRKQSDIPSNLLFFL